MPLTDVAIEMVRTGIGILTMPKWEISSYSKSAGLIQLRLGREGIWRKHYAAIRHEDAHKKHLLDFIGELIKVNDQVSHQSENNA